MLLLSKERKTKPNALFKVEETTSEVAEADITITSREVDTILAVVITITTKEAFINQSTTFQTEAVFSQQENNYLQKSKLALASTSRTTDQLHQTGQSLLTTTEKR